VSHRISAQDPNAPAPNLPDVSTETRLALTAALLFNALRGLLVILLLALAIVVPYLSANKTGSAIVVSSIALLMLITPYALLRRGKIMQAAWIFSGSGTVIFTVLVIFAGGVRSPAIVYQLAMAVVALILIGRRKAFLCGVAALGADLVLALGQRAGFQPPVLFPYPALSTWFNLMLSGVLTLPLVYQAMVWLTGALDNSRRQIERLKKNQEVLSYQAQLIAQAAEPVVATDINGAVTYWNASAENAFGWPETEALGRNIYELLAFAPGSVSPDEIRDHLEHDGRWIGEVQCLNRAGSRVIVEAAMTTLTDSSGQVVGTVASLRDITEQRQLEERFRHSQKMESIGRLAGGIAHDFNNYIMIINWHGEMLASHLAPDDSAKEMLAQIMAANDQTKSLTAQLLAFSRKQVLEPRILNLNQVVQETAKMIRRLIGEDIEVITHLASDLGPVNADPSQIYQVLMNLVVNARDAMPSGGTLILETSDVELDEVFAEQYRDLAPGAYVHLAVSDTGCGMDDETLRHIFEPFFTTKAAGTGTGLGLATVYGVMHQSGGSVLVHSQPGRGATFNLYFPRTQATGAAGAASGMPAPIALSGTETVLVTEDHREVRAMLAGSLKEYGYKVVEACNGAEALERSASQSGPIDLLITDVIMPGMTGRDLAGKLTAIHSDLKVLYISGYAANLIAQQDALGPGTAFLHKPFTMSTLAVKVRELLGRDRCAGQTAAR
jgi:PAS domain S-box-containing protein